MTNASSFLAIAWVASLWQGTAMVLLAAAFLRFMPRAGAALRHALLVAAFVLAVMLPLIPVHQHYRTEAHTGVALAPWIAAVIALIWLAASSVRAAGLLAAWRHLRRVRATAAPIEMQAVVAGNRRAILCASDDVDTPAVLGFFRPILLLPRWLVPTLTAAELSDIAMHECEHLRRRDDWTNLLLQIGLVLMPLNPALLWLNRRIATERELACDAAVVAATTRPLAYAASLTRLAERRIRHRGLRLALAALGRKSELSLRVHALLTQPAAPWSQRRSVAAMCASAAMLLAVTMGMAHAPALVTFTKPLPVAQTAYVPPPVFAEPASSAVMLPVSYRTKPSAKQTRRSVKQLARFVSAHNTTPKAGVTFRRAAATADATPFMDAVQSDVQPARTLTVEFIPAYVAVPVTNGWLLIEL